MFVREIMTDGICCTGCDTSVQHIAFLMKKNDIGAVVITDDHEKILGIITDRDLVLRAMAGKGETASDIMTKDPVCISPDMDALAAVSLFSRYKVRRLPVVRGEKAIGFLSLSDMAKDKAFIHEAGDILHLISRV